MIGHQSDCESALSDGPPPLVLLRRCGGVTGEMNLCKWLLYTIQTVDPV